MNSVDDVIATIDVERPAGDQPMIAHAIAAISRGDKQ
jgi:hypothetical protein